MTHHPLTKTGNPPIGQLETRQYRGLIEQYELYLEKFWSDCTILRCSPEPRPLSIQKFYDSPMFELPPKDQIIRMFRVALRDFYNAGQELVANWPHEMEMMLDRQKVEACLTMSFDEWLAEFVAILPEEYR